MKAIFLTLILISLFYSSTLALNKCEAIISQDGQILGPEDLTRITDNIILVASSDRVQTNIFPNGPFGFDSENPETQGKISLYNTKSDTLSILNLNLNFNFQPFGIYFDENSNKLFTINNKYEETGTTIEVFDIEIVNVDTVNVTHSQTLTHSSEFTGIFNDLILISSGKLLLTTFSHPMPIDGNQSDVSDVVNSNFGVYEANELVFKIHLCEYNSSSTEQTETLSCSALDGTGDSFNNGIDWDRQNTVLAGNTFNSKVTVYTLSQDNNAVSLTKIQDVVTNFQSDNIVYDSERNGFTVTGQSVDGPIFEQSLEERREYLEIEDKEASINVGFISYNSNKNQYEMSMLFSGNTVMDGASTTVIEENTLIVGNWFDRSISKCPIQEKPEQQSSEGSQNHFFLSSLILIIFFFL